MLLHHYLANSQTPSGAPGFRDTWQNTIDNLGYPNNLRKISLINGSINGTTTGTACQTVVEMKTILKFRVYFFLYLGWKPVAASDISFAGSYGNSCEVFKGWAFSIFNSNSKNAAAPTSNKSYDIVPGGTYTAQKEITDGEGYAPFINIPGFSVGTKTNFNLIRPDHCFIPTKSSLGMNMQNTDLGENLYNRDLVCTGETPFQSYYAPFTNEEHITLTPQNVNWITKEIDGINQPSTVNYQALYPITLVSGTEPICTSGTTYRVANLPSGATLTWNASPSGIIQFSCNTCAQPTISAIGSGTVTVTASITSSTCGNFRVSQEIIVGIPVFEIAADVPCQPGSIVQQSIFTATPSDLAATYHWRWVSNNVSHSLASTEETIYKKFTLGSYQVYAWAENSCGSNQNNEAVVSFDVELCPEGMQAPMLVSPNPASSTLNVEVNNETQKTTDHQAHIETIELIDKTGNMRLRKQFGKGMNKVNLSITHLPHDVYTMRVFDGKAWSAYKILIQH